MKNLESLKERIIKALEEKGFRVIRRGLINGISGVKHFFDLVVEDPRRGSRLAVSLSDKVSFEHIFSILATRMDTRTGHLLIAKEVDREAIELLQKVNVTTLILGGKFSLISNSIESGEELILDVIIRQLKGEKE